MKLKILKLLLPLLLWACVILFTISSGNKKIEFQRPEIQPQKIEKTFNGYILVKGYDNYVCWAFTGTRKRQPLPNSYITIRTPYGDAYIYSDYRVFHLTEKNWSQAAQILKIDFERCGTIIGEKSD